VRIRNVVTIGAMALLLMSVPACSSSAKHPAAGASQPAAVTSAAPAPATQTSAPASTVETSSAPAAVPSAATPATSGGGSGGVTFDGAYTGTLKITTCLGSGSSTTASVDADYSTGEKLSGTVSSSEFGFEGPNNTQFDSGFQKSPLDVDGSGFKLDGLKVTDPGAGKTLTMHGTLHCP
jgi:hypothetical protein